MSGQRDEIAMTPAEIEDFLRGGRICVLVTLGPDGLPDPVPMWYVVDDAGTLVMRTFAKSQKAVNLRRDPRFAGLVEDGHRYDELRGVQLSGTVEVVDDLETVATTLVELGVKYEGLDLKDVEAAREGALSRAAKQVALRLHPDRVVSWDHGKLGPHR